MKIPDPGWITPLTHPPSRRACSCVRLKIFRKRIANCLKKISRRVYPIRSAKRAKTFKNYDAILIAETSATYLIYYNVTYLLNEYLDVSPASFPQLQREKRSSISGRNVSCLLLRHCRRAFSVDLHRVSFFLRRFVIVCRLLPLIR